MNDVINSYGTCDAEKCKRLDRLIVSEDDLVIEDQRQYHKGCEPTEEVRRARNRSYT